jgi:prepilin-type N-terminal cleavage/methylation domain-containing protein
MFEQMKRARSQEEGFTLIELLIAIVVVGILTAVAIVGIGSLTDNGKTSACNATLDASKAATAVFYANSNGTYPTSFTQLTTGNELDVPTGVAATATTLKHGTDWTLTGTFDATGATAPVFACS